MDAPRPAANHTPEWVEIMICPVLIIRFLSPRLFVAACSYVLHGLSDGSIKNEIIKTNFRERMIEKLTEDGPGYRPRRRERFISGTALLGRTGGLRRRALPGDASMFDEFGG